VGKYEPSIGDSGWYSSSESEFNRDTDNLDGYGPG